MFKRIAKFSTTNSFFLFGPRGTGKTHLLKSRFQATPTLYIDLLNPETFQTLSLAPNRLSQQLAALPKSTRWIIIDEVQRIPALLDIVHQQIESSRFHFVLTGSSARKLRHGSANLLAGRAFVYHLFPLTKKELGDDFSLDDALRWGTLPRIFGLQSNREKQEYLRSYTHTYLQEEITQEQVVRKLDPFRRFLVIAAQMSGQIINFSKIARDAGTGVPTVQSYFQILEDTLIGTLVESFHESVRKRQRENPKFYFFDTGVQRALENTLTVDLLPQTYAYGVAFEHFIINEIQRLQSYQQKDYRFSYLRTQAGVEIDLIVERPGKKRLLLEIKSTERAGPEDVRNLKRLAPEISNSETLCMSRDPVPKMIDGVRCVPWQLGFKEMGLTD